MMRQETEQRCAQQKICGYEYTVKRGDSFYLIAQRLGVPLRDLLEANSEVNPARLMVGDVLCIPMEEDDAVTTPAQEPIGNATKPTPPDQAVVTSPTHELTAAPQTVETPNLPEQPAIQITIATADTAPQSAVIQTEYEQHEAVMESVEELVISAMPAVPETTVPDEQTEAAADTNTPPAISPETDAAAPQEAACYTLADGETAADVMQKADVSLKTLSAANPGVDLDGLKAGDQLCVPAENKPCSTARFYRMEEGGNIEALALLMDVSVAALLRANPCLRPSDFKAGAIISLP